jgi:GYF domain 2
MHYHVSRGGQTYGPYTLADLQRYVASGHILLSDLAKSEEMGDWIPVGQILSAPAPEDAAATPSPEFQPEPTAAQGYTEPQPYYGSPQPYAATQAPGYASPGAVNLYPDPPNLHWALVLLIDLFTCGLFQIVWNFVIAAWLKRVQPNTKALVYYAVGYGLLLLYSGLSFPIFLAQMHHIDTHPHFGAGLLGLIAWVFRLVARFTVKASLEEHFNGPEPIGYTMNPVMLFFFGGLYIQAELNRVNQIKQSIRYREASF